MNSIYDGMPKEWKEKTPVNGDRKEDGGAEQKSSAPCSLDLPDKDSDLPLKETTKKEKQREKERDEKYRRKMKEEKRKRSKSEIEGKKQRGNRKDFLIVSIMIVFVIAGIAIVCAFIASTKNQDIYSRIDSGTYATAYQEIYECYENGENVDDMVMQFAQRCVDDSEYKRAVASLDMLSEDAVKNPEFFLQLAEQLKNHEKENRAADVVHFLENRGGEWAAIAKQIKL